MASSKTVSKGIRITNEAAEYFKDKPMNRMIESMIPLLERGELSFDGETLKIESGVHSQKGSGIDDLASEMSEMAVCMGMEPRELTEGLFHLLEEGQITIVGKEILVELPDWAGEFEFTCQERGLEVEKVAQKAILAIRKGDL